MIKSLYSLDVIDSHTLDLLLVGTVNYDDKMCPLQLRCHGAANLYIYRVTALFEDTFLFSLYRIMEIFFNLIFLHNMLSLSSK